MRLRGPFDRFNFAAGAVLAGGPIFLILLIGVTLLRKAAPILQLKGLGELLLGRVWQPTAGNFGFLPFIAGTVWVTVIAMLVAVPVSVLTAIFLAEYATKRFRAVIVSLIDLLAGIPPVVFGLWGMAMIIPFMSDYLMPAWTKVFGAPAGANPMGYSVLSGGLVLAVMIFPTIISISYEVLRAIPNDLKEASFALGATHWLTIRHVIWRRALPGIFAGCLLGLTRAIGETMAVLMVSGNVPIMPRSPFSSGYPLPALIANNYGEMMSIPLYESALMLAAFILFAVLFIVSGAAWGILLHLERRRR